VNRLYIRISKFLSYVLRHHPEKFNIELDTNGYADFETIINLVNNQFLDHHIDEEVIKDIISLSDKKRFEINNDKIRAFYGHSIKDKIDMQEAKNIPLKLFHGTNSKAQQKIVKEGLKRKSRQYVHLSDSLDTAYSVGRRRTHSPIILVIESSRAANDGVQFYKSGDMYLADYIPPEYISIYIKKKIS